MFNLQTTTSQRPERKSVGAASGFMSGGKPLSAVICRACGGGRLAFVTLTSRRTNHVKPSKQSVIGTSAEKPV